MSRSFNWYPEVVQPAGGSVTLGLADIIAQAFGHDQDNADDVEGLTLDMSTMPILKAMRAMAAFDDQSEALAQIMAGIERHGRIVFRIEY